MIEYDRGKFGSILNFAEALKALDEAILANVTVRALHIGTPPELELRKKEASLFERVEALEAKMDSQKPLSTVIHIPTEVELRKFCKEEE